MSEYGFYGDDWDKLQHSYGSSSNHTYEHDGEATPVEYMQAVFGFFLALLVYFCLLCNLWLRDGSITKEEIERSIVHKRVLAHGQSHCFDCDNDKKVKDSCRSCSCRSTALFCCSRRKKRLQTILPASTDVIKDSNRCDDPAATSQCSEDTVDINIDAEQHQCNDTLNELDQAEQGVISLEQEITCPICLEPLLIGEEVAWSKLKHCKHYFHFECIMHWLVQGHMYCPVCRDRFWKRNYRRCKANNVCTKIIYRKESDPVDKMDARRFLFCEVHGLTWPEDSVEATSSSSSCASSGSAVIEL